MQATMAEGFVGAVIGGDNYGHGSSREHAARFRWKPSWTACCVRQFPARCNIRIFAKALPELPAELLRMRLMLAGGSLLIFVRQLIEFALQELIEFVSLGMKKKVCSSALQAMTLPFFETLRL
jgi:hypothetical protein